ncbi:MAG TPA: hypothetical protein VGL56_20230 [Fimbriimonadaceae bacterium]|jgi:hypothetical protein
MSSKEHQILAIIGDPQKIRQEMLDFKRTARTFSSDKVHLLAKYRKQWVAAHDGKIVAHAAALPRLLQILDELGIPRQKAMIRYIDQNARKLIL